MKYKQVWQGTFAALGMLILILDGKTALEGARTGIELCLKSVIPSLFPFFLLSTLLIKSFSGCSLSLLRPLRKLCKIPEGTEAILLSGFLGGYPVGAQSISQAYHEGTLRKADAERMLAFCNNAGPSFLFGMVSFAFPNKWYIWGLWGIHIISAIFVAQIFPGIPSKIQGQRMNPDISFSIALQSAIRIMATVCGWVIVFRVMVSFLYRWVLWLLPVEVQVLVTGLLELSNGCSELIAVSDARVRFVICSVMLAFGGLCVSLQTISVVHGLSLRFYFCGKLIQTLFSIIFSCGMMYNMWFSCFSILIISLTLLIKMQKKSSIYAAVGV